MRTNYVPALAVSVLLHLGLLALLLFTWESQTLNTGDNSVAVTLVSSVKTAPEPLPTPPQPVETAPPEALPQSEPQPAPPPPPKPALKAVKPVKPTSTFDLGKLAAELPSHPTKPSPRSSGPTFKLGPTAAPVGANDLAGMADKVQRLWAVNCDLPGSQSVQAEIRFTISSDGYISSGPDLGKHSGGGAFMDAGSRAVAAVKAGAPYSLSEVPAKARNQPITMRFHACQ
jgi:hypothetical protein